MSHPKKILVVGVGIAGPAVCYWLKKFGFEPTLIEKQTQVRKGGQALDIRGVAVEVVKKMGVYKKICDMRTQVAYDRYVDTEGNTVHEEYGEKTGFRQGEDVEILRGDLVEILLKSIEGTSCYFNQMIDKITESADYVNVHFNDGRVLKYDLIIGADGMHSSIRRMIFTKDEYDFVNLGSYISIFNVPNYLHLKHSGIMCEHHQKLAIMTSDHDFNTAQAGFMFRSKHVLENIRDETEQKQFLYDTYKDFGWEALRMLELMSSSSDFYFDSTAQVKMSRWTKGRIALVGDAGYCASPLSGQGTSLALVGAYILAGELKVAGGDFSRGFDRYNELLQPFVAANQDFGVWSSKSFLVDNDEVFKEVAADRSDRILEMLQTVANAIDLPDYSSSD